MLEMLLVFLESRTLDANPYGCTIPDLVFNVFFLKNLARMWRKT